MKRSYMPVQWLLCVLLLSVLVCCGDTDSPEISTKNPQISLNKTELTLEVEKCERLVASFEPENTENKGHQWSSSDSKIATVDETGMVKGVSVGEAEITAKALAGGSKATCKVTIVEKIIPVTGITISRTSANVVEGDTIHLSASVKPENATDRKITWSSSNEEIATVDDEGVVTGIKEGNANIIATSNDGDKKATCKLTVDYNGVKVSKVVLNKTTATVIEGDTIHLIPFIQPENATNKKISWSSSDNQIASVDEKGVVKAISEGSATITAKTEEGEKTATCKMTVKFRGVRFSVPTVSNITSSSAQVKGTFEFSGVNISEYGCAYKSAENTNGNEVKIKFADNSDNAILTGLEQNTKYEVRLYATYSGKTEYSGQTTFTTKGELKTDFQITDVYIDELRFESPACKGYNTVNICYGTKPSPKVTDNVATATTSGDKLILDVKNLQKGTKYYFRSYIEEGNKIKYSDDEIEYSTLSMNLSSSCDVSYNVSGKGLTEIRFLPLSGAIYNLHYAIAFEYNFNTNHTYKVSLDNCFEYTDNPNYSTPTYIEGNGIFEVTREFRAQYFNDREPEKLYVGTSPKWISQLH